MVIINIVIILPGSDKITQVCDVQLPHTVEIWSVDNNRHGYNYNIQIYPPPFGPSEVSATSGANLGSPLLVQAKCVPPAKQI